MVCYNFGVCCIVGNFFAKHLFVLYIIYVNIRKQKIKNNSTTRKLLSFWMRSLFNLRLANKCELNRVEQVFVILRIHRENAPNATIQAVRKETRGLEKTA